MVSPLSVWQPNEEGRKKEFTRPAADAKARRRRIYRQEYSRTFLSAD